MRDHSGESVLLRSPWKALQPPNLAAAVPVLFLFIVMPSETVFVLPVTLGIVTWPPVLAPPGSIAGKDMGFRDRRSGGHT